MTKLKSCNKSGSKNKDKSKTKSWSELRVTSHCLKTLWTYAIIIYRSNALPKSKSIQILKNQQATCSVRVYFRLWDININVQFCPCTQVILCFYARKKVSKKACFINDFTWNKVKISKKIVSLINFFPFSFL